MKSKNSPPASYPHRASSRLIITFMRPRFTSWRILIFTRTAPPMKNDPSTLPIVLPWWKPALGRLARKSVEMVPAGPRVISPNVELGVTPFACPKEGRGWQGLLQGILEPIHEPVV